MGLKCSVFGHDYADYDVERERTDHGEEVVTTVRTTEICRRCGDARVVSENTEIAATSPEGTDGSRAEGNGASSGEGGTHAGTDRERTDGAREGLDGSRDGGGDGGSPRSGSRGFEFDGAATGDPGDPGDAATEDRSVGPTTAHATSRSLAESELRCPDCGFSERVLGSALRAGDSCPACSRGYLVRRTRKG